MRHIQYIFSILILICSIITGCADDPKMPDNLIGVGKPEVSTGDLTVETTSSISISGILVKTNGASVTEQGFVWYEASNPGRRDSVRTNLEIFSATIENLKNSTNYVIHAYAKNEAGIGYGNGKSFQTIPPVFNKVAEFSGSVYIEGSPSYFVMGNRGYIVGGDGGAKYTNELWEFSPDNNTLKNMLPFNINGTDIYRSWMSGSATGVALILYGGRDESRNLTSDLFAYKNTNAWEQLKYKEGAFPGPMAESASCYTSSGIMFFGGIKKDPTNGEEIITDDIWTLNVILSPLVWDKMDKKLPEKQYGGVAFVIDTVINKVSEKILYTGLGKSTSTTTPSFSNRFWSLSLTNDGDWQEEEIMPGDMVKAGVVHEKSIYVIDNNGYIWKFDTQLKKWERKSMLPGKNNAVHCMFTLRNSNNKELIYIGFGKGDTRELISYDPTQDIY